MGIDNLQNPLGGQIDTTTKDQHGNYARDVFNGQGHLLIDREGCPSYDGDPMWLDDFEERARNYLFGVKKADRSQCVQRTKCHLFGRAHTLTHKVPEISAKELESIYDEEKTDK